MLIDRQDKDGGVVTFGNFEHLMERFEGMVSGYNRLMEALKKKYEPLVKKVKSNQTDSPKSSKKTDKKKNDG